MIEGAAMTSTLSYFKWAFIVTAVGLLASAAYGYFSFGAGGALTFLFITAVLAVLEISLSFDNAVVNANKLKAMSHVWQRRFLTWGILIAVFGMRLVFPLVIVALAAKIGPIAAIHLAFAEPRAYAEIMHHAHLPIAAFGGTFLLMVGLTYFFDHDKDVHWLPWLEEPMARSASIKGIEIGIALVLILVFSGLVAEERAQDFLYPALYGLITFLAVEILSGFLDASQAKAAKTAAQGGLGAFIYLEVLDASFSFDGVVGAFALTKNLLVIAIGLGIGAMYVRSLTILLVDRKTLSQFRFLEHGAFYAILVLAVIMFAQTLVHIPEAVTGLVGAGLIGLSLWSSLRWRKLERIKQAL
ncbi:DUF475 domain-containing protein [Martelella lutilitoris]|uniref:DUF475 domain-containing protein n=1 Tax=Martelella lutilitoris TaxID=2583532 RepID=A0A7T7KND6_9HYPH|nr:DUF475 domain-containing protein [Martelella lutilitoris]QQM32747.1 DUF475 domain-containing protein [Martelella lutilitoris]